MGVTLFEADIFTLLNDIVSAPAAFGLTDATNRCFDFTTVCPNPEEFFFYDVVHPTTAGHDLIAGVALSVIPEPSTALLLASGLVAMALRRARR